MSTFKVGGNANKMYYAIILGAVVILTICLMSKEFMFNDDPIAQTEFNRPISGLNYNTVSLKKWEYNPDKDMMQVHFKTEASGGVYANTKLSFKAQEKNKPGTLPVKLVFNQGNMYVVQIENVSKEYKVVGLTIKETPEVTSLEKGISDTNNEGGTVKNVDNNNAKPKSIMITGDYRKVKENRDLLRKSSDEYLQEETEEELKIVKLEMKNIEKSIPMQDELSDKILNEVERIEANKQYQTDEEKRQSDSEIQSRKLQMEQYKKQKGELGVKLKEMKEKEKKLEKKLEDQRKQFNVSKEK